ncbi:MAG: hypothetical protein ACFFCW_37790 [Candidatus Hodarchaeota archaeon]
MPEIHIFENVDEAVNKLKRYNKNIKREHKSPEYIVEKSVEGNIFRAFRKLDKSPSEIYRGWANQNIHLIIDELQKIKTKQEFDRRLDGWINSLINYWDGEVEKHQRIIYGPASKMVNLLLKVLNESIHMTNNEIQRFLHVPFDQYTLTPLIKIINYLTDVNYKIYIPKNVTMSYISDPQLYQIIQDAVVKLCEQSVIDPILYDYWCWNEKH